MKIFLIYFSYFSTLAPTFISGATVPNLQFGKCTSTCTTPVCTKEGCRIWLNYIQPAEMLIPKMKPFLKMIIVTAEFFKKYMDFAANPCDDFYQFVCGNYVKNVPIPEDKVGVTHFETIIDKIHIELISELKAAVKPSDLKAINNVKTHYQNCLDEDAIEEIGVAPLVKLINELGGWPVLRGNAWKDKDYKWEETISKISKQGFLPDFPVKLSVGYDLTNSSSYILQIMPAVTTIDESYFVIGSRSLEAYETLMIDIAVLLGATRINATKELKECSKFEIELFQLRSTVPNPSIPVEYRQTVKSLSREYPGLPWLSIFKSILNPSNVNIDENQVIEISNPPFTSKIKQLIGKTSKRVLANYQIWRVIFDLIDYLPRYYRDHKFNFYKAVYGIQSLPQRDEVCFNWVQPLFETVIGAMYAKKYFDKKSKDRANEIIQYVKNEFQSTLHKVKWMDDQTRRNALEKLQAMMSLVGFPDELTDDSKIEHIYKDLKIHAGNFFEGYRRVSNHSKNQNFNKLRKTVNETQWISETHVADASALYDVGMNKIRILAGILQEPFFKFDRPDYLNYGAIGHFVGHEIIHGFDSTGRKFDKFGNYNNWWDKKTTDEFEKRVKCLVDQFNGYFIKQINQKVNGNLTKGENIADGGGIKIAYHAYQKFTNRTGKTEQCLPNLNYSPQQMFWISAASTWCSKSTDEFMHTLLVDVHSPSEARVNIGFSNIQEFSDDFGCLLGSKMNPRNKCIVW